VVQVNTPVLLLGGLVAAVVAIIAAVLIPGALMERRQRADSRQPRHAAQHVDLPAARQVIERKPVASRPPWPVPEPEPQARVLPPLPPVTISTCRAADCIARQSHPTHHHDKWLAKYLATLPLGRLSASARQPEPLPGSGIWPTPLPAAVREHLGAETVTGAMRQIFPDEVTADA
jgi:hypothetical protein